MRRHPAGLYVLFFTEMWERFGFYCMSAVFALYMEDKLNGHKYLQDNHEQILGLYLGFVYFTPFFGGLIADRVLGYRACVYLGGLLLAGGYFLLAYSPLYSFFAGLVLIVLGNGLFKPNISTMVGKLYLPNDPRLDSAYTIFYMGINIGAFISPLVAGTLCTQFRRPDGFDGYHVAFVAAGAGMLFSVLLFALCRRWVTGSDGPALSAQPISSEEVVPANVQLRRHLALLIIFAVVILFWMAFKQNAGKFNFWFRDHTIRTPSAWLYDLLGSLNLKGTLLDSTGQFNKTVQSAINPFFVIAFSPLMVLLWLGLKARGWEPSTPAKVAIGMLLTAGAFGVMTMGAVASGESVRIDETGKTIIEAGKVSGGYLVGAYAILTLGELCLSPMGLSLVSKLAAPKWRSMWMGGWFVATAIGGYLSSGFVGEYWKKPWPPSKFFAVLAGTSLVAFAITMATYPIVRRAMPGAKK